MTKLSEKTIKLFLIWAMSDHLSEAANAKTLLEQELKKDGLDMHAVAEQLRSGGGYTEEQMVEAYRRGRDEERQKMVTTSNTQTDWNRIAKEVLANPHVLRNDKEREVVPKFARLTECGEELSDKQRKWLADIYARI
jgi:hypothetical protein